MGKNISASASSIDVLSIFSQDSLCSLMDKVRYSTLRGYSKAQQDDILGDSLLHLCEKARNGYFSKLDSLSDVNALIYTIVKHKAGDERDKIQTYRKHMDIVPDDISNVFDGKFDLAEDVDDFEDQKDMMYRFINALPGKEGKVLKMSVVGYSDNEIMATLHMSRNSVQKARSTAKSKVKRFMNSSEYGRSNSRSETRSSAEANASADFYYSFGKNSLNIPLIKENKTNKTMKMKNNISRIKRKNHSISKSIAGERLVFMGGVQLGDISIAIESGSTKRMVRRILEKRVNQYYWNHVVDNNMVKDNRHRATSKKYVSDITRIIFGCPLVGYEFWA